jgi:hypothetical protein
MVPVLTLLLTRRILERGMTNEELFQDLKQFITATVSQQTAHLATKADIDGVVQRIDLIEVKMATKEDLKDTEHRLSEKMDRVQDAIAETLTKAVEAVDTTKKVEDHERRLTRLEHRTA